MATTAAAFTPTAVSGAVVGYGRKTQKTTNKVVHIRGLNSYGGLKAQNSVVALGQPVSTEHCFAKIVNSFRAASYGKRRGGGAFAAQCTKVAEIFEIAGIINGLVLIGVAIGFVLLRIETAVEESE